LIEKHALDLRKTLRKGPPVIVIGIGNAKVSVEELPTCEPELQNRIVDGHCDTSSLNVDASLPHGGECPLQGLHFRTVTDRKWADFRLSDSFESDPRGRFRRATSAIN
jgi:hypothetical protein